MRTSSNIFDIDIQREIKDIIDDQNYKTVSQQTSEHDKGVYVSVDNLYNNYIRYNKE